MLKPKNSYKQIGFNTNDFDRGCNPCGLFLENQNITFPSIEGIVYFNPNLIKPRLQPVKFFERS